MLGPFTTASRLTPIHQMSLAALSRAACASMSKTTPTTTTTTTRDRGDCYGPMEWAQLYEFSVTASAAARRRVTNAPFLWNTRSLKILFTIFCTLPGLFLHESTNNKAFHVCRDFLQSPW